MARHLRRSSGQVLPSSFGPVLLIELVEAEADPRNLGNTLVGGFSVPVKKGSGNINR